MSLLLKSRRGSVLLYTLLLLLFCFGYIHVQVQKFALYTTGQKHMRIIQERLNLEYEIQSILNALPHDFEYETFTSGNHSIYVEKNDEIIHVSVSGACELSHKYAIISDDSLKWRQIE